MLIADFKHTLAEYLLLYGRKPAHCVGGEEIVELERGVRGRSESV